MNRMISPFPATQSLTLYSIGYFRSLDHFLFLDNIEKKIDKILSKVLNTFENNMEMEHLLQKSKCSIFHNIFKYMIFQRCQKALLWSKGLNMQHIKWLMFHGSSKGPGCFQ